MQLGYRYRIYPTADQAEALLAQMDRCRWVWNQARALR
jgi:Helix-turn-helix domain